MFSSSGVIFARHCKQNFFHRIFNAVRSEMGNSARCLLDFDLLSGALTRAHAGFAELRPPRSSFQNIP
jgi:hypothetical protein